eukprot:gb/GEZN01001897.1/.p1 GENE.gb/GEZN01001897.1/~~gb/GEZN01001897.1/.p1  ORF type:complete len:872 (+),score=197.90 gb/GEZN01001897.1/:119-2617(+)
MSDDEEGSDGEQDAGISLDEEVASGDGVSQSTFAKVQQEFDKVKLENDSVQSELEDTKKRLTDLKTLSNTAKQIQDGKYNQILKSLMDDFENHKQEMRLAVIQAGGDKSLLEAKMKDMTRSTQLLKDVEKYKQDIKELEGVGVEMVKEINELKEKMKQLENDVSSRPKTPKPGAKKPAAKKAAAKKLSAEGATLSDSDKKKLADYREKNSKMTQEIRKLKEQLDKTKRPPSRNGKDSSRPPSRVDDVIDPSSSEEAKKLAIDLSKAREAMKQQAQAAADALQVTRETAEKMMTEAVNELKKELAAAKALIEQKDSVKLQQAEVEKAKASMDEALAKTQRALEKANAANEAKEENARMHSDSTSAQKKLIEENSKLNQRFTQMQAIVTLFQDRLHKLVGSAEERKKVLTSTKEESSTVSGEIKFCRGALVQMAGVVPAMGPKVISALQEYNEKRNAEAEAMRRAHKELVESYAKEQKLRREYFTELMDLKGNIRVYCRIRPMNHIEKAAPGNLECVTFPDEDTLLLRVGTESRGVTEYTKTSFSFEQIFPPGTTQAQIFEKVHDLVVSVMTGFNVCVFAYGQTGSGKTYTMEGVPEDPGVNSRALKSLFDLADSDPGVDYNVDMTLLEIYNNQIRDLITGNSNLKCVSGEYGMEVPELKKVKVRSQAEVLTWWAEGGKNRTAAKTDMNAHSSRSHLILSVYVLGTNKGTKKVTMGKLHLIDLAGSERVGRSGVGTDQKRMKEAQAINTSLSALGNCIEARGRGQTHVPYRDSMLTYLLQDSLEKNSKTLMFVQISPMATNAAESLCSLKFANRASKVELGKAEKNTLKKPSKK